MSNGIDIVIGGEVSGALAAMTAVEQRTLVLQSRIVKLQQVAGTTQNIDKMNRSLMLLSKTQNELSRISAKNSFAGITKGSSEATASMVNLSRVVQDAPYGFIGIANNLNPLLESFQRLKTSTGTTGGALKALGKELTGGAGLGLAIGVASSLLVVFGDKLFGASKAAKEAKSASDAMKDSISGIFAESAKEAANAAGFVAILKSETETRERKLSAINELQKIQPEIFANLKLEGNAVIGLDNAYKSYLENLKTVIAVKIKQAQLEQKIAELLQKQGITLTASEKKIKDMTEAFKKSDLERAKRAGGGEAQSYVEYLLGSEQKNKDALKTIENDINALIGDITQLSKGVKTGEIKIKPDKVEVKPKRVVIDFNQTVVDKQIDNLLKYMFDKDVKFDFIAPELIPPEEAKQQGLTFSQMFGHEVEKYFKQTDPIDFGLNKAVREFKPPKTFSFKMFEGLSEEQFKLAESAELITNTLAPAFDNLINAIGRGENAFQAFGEGVKQVLVQVISKLVQTALLAAALSAIFPGGLGGAKGFGSIFSSLLGFGGARAGGGPVSFGKSYLVGENGPELFVPANSGRIMNGNQIAAMSYSGGGSSGGGRQIVRGQNIILAYARTNRAQNRLGRG